MRTRSRFTKNVFLVAVLISLVAASTAGATHIFDDVPDDKFYAVPVEWAAANGITTGTSPTTFEPDRGVTRGESVTFLKRYDDTIVQPALAAMPEIHTARVRSDGTLVKGSPGVTSTRTGTGAYDVTFPVDVVDCMWNATPTAPGGVVFLFDSTEVFATVTGGTTSFLFPFVLDPDLVTVTIFDEDGVLQDWRFDLVVFC